MLRSVLIANRGEIACRIARTAKRLGMRTIAVYSEADVGALHTRLCDEAYLIGGPQPRASYLAIENLIAAAKRAGAECVHPGYGFLSENADFAEACAQAGLVFVGPPASAIRAMGLKDHAKKLMARACVPVVPGYHGERQDAKFLREKAYQIGYPVLIKPAAGGGGRGMRRVDKHADFDAALEGAVRESQSAFGTGRLLIEKFVASPRHIEIQVFADSHGNAIHLGERDCSLQRRHQKVIEEALAPGMTPDLRAAIGKAAVVAAKAVEYRGAGTVEFVADGTAGLRADGFWFIEMNTRLQVEHPVTEEVTGLDLVEWQFRIAAGEKLPLRQNEIQFAGHAIEARVYAEDPERGFLPSTGTIVALEFPDTIRVDSGIEAGDEVPPFYDPMIAKLIAHAPTRDGALDRLAQALDATVIAGVRTNVPFLANLCRAAAFRQGKVDTGFIDRDLTALGAAPREPDWGAAACGATLLVDAIAVAQEEASPHEADAPDEYSPWSARDGFQLGSCREISLPILIDGEDAQAVITYGNDGPRLTVRGVEPASDARLFQSGAQAYVLRGGRQTRVRIKDFAASAAEAGGGDNVIKAPMHGRVLELLAGIGDRVVVGQRLAVIEAMKMEHTLRAPFAAVVKELPVSTGAQVVEGAPIMVLERIEILEASSE
ncbi:MAG TPA: biotin carboxylase N-terminal domain-containing protein [Xanthobacteraceae bacterium]|jgi:3-methylcrotonyl-CoA carboxylase alpha subunit|nr:biotin carboxylase N-terminal domain-containing protein [Xanthobacteraceae bacterium]